MRGLAARFGSGGTLKTIGGAAIGFFGARFIPQNISILAPYNTGISGYALNAAAGLGVSYLAGKFLGREYLTGGLIGTGLAVITRIVTDYGPGAVSGSALQGDLDFDLGYYIDDQFPFAQGASGGPYATFPGSPYRSNAMIPTSASAVRAGNAAAAAVAALPAQGGSSGGWKNAGRWGTR